MFIPKNLKSLSFPSKNCDAMAAILLFAVIVLGCCTLKPTHTHQSRITGQAAARRLGRLILKPDEVISQHSEVDAQFTMTSVVGGVNKTETPPPSRVVADVDYTLDPTHGKHIVAVQGRGGELISVGQRIRNPIIDALATMTLYMQLNDIGRAISLTGYDHLFESLRKQGLSPAALKVLKESIVKLPEDDTTILAWNSAFAEMAGREYVPGQHFSMPLTFAGLLGTVSATTKVTIMPVAEGCPSTDCLSIRFEADPVTEALVSSSSIRIDEALQINTSTPAIKGGITPGPEDMITTRISGERIHDRNTMHVFRDNYTIEYDIDVKRPDDTGGPIRWEYIETHHTTSTVTH